MPSSNSEMGKGYSFNSATAVMPWKMAGGRFALDLLEHSQLFWQSDAVENATYSTHLVYYQNPSIRPRR